MKHILLTIMATIGLVSCCNLSHCVQDEANANTQNPIMPIVFVGENTEVILTDYLPALTAEDEVVFTTEPSYTVTTTANGFLLNGDNTLSVLGVDVPAKGLHYDIPIVPKAQYEVGLVTKSFSDSTITISVLNEYEQLQWCVLWQDTRATKSVEYSPADDQAVITIEPAWRESKGRSFIRVYAHANGKQLNDLLIPMQDGKVVNDVAELTRFDDHAQILYSLMIDRFHNGNKQNVSGAWNAHEEPWWAPTFGKAWTYASLKGSYSLTADRGPATNSLAVFTSFTPWRPSTPAFESGITLEALENSELTYEKKHELNIGVAFGFVDNRVNVEFDWYRRNNFDLIGFTQTMGVGGVTTKLANDATMQSTGCEFTISTTNIKTKDFKWTTDWIFGWAENEITKLDSRSQVYELVLGYGRTVNRPIGALYSIPFAGLTEEGLPTFYIDAEQTQVAGPGNYDAIYFQEYENVDYLKYEGSIDPTITGSFGNTFSWKGLKLNVFFTYSFGNVLRLDNL